MTNIALFDLWGILGYTTAVYCTMKNSANRFPTIPKNFLAIAFGILALVGVANFIDHTLIKQPSDSSLDHLEDYLDLLFLPFFIFFTYTFKASHDRAEREQIEESLQEKENLFRSLVENIPGVVYRCRFNTQWNFFHISQTITAITGYPAENFQGNSRQFFNAIIHPEDRARVEKTMFEGIAEHAPLDLVYRINHLSGAIHWVQERARCHYDPSGQPCYLDGVIFDITDKKEIEKEISKLEIEVKQSQKMLAIATLAGGIAHDFNNILAAIMGFCKLVQESLPKGSEAMDFTNHILEAGNRATNLVRQILSFSRQQEDKLKPLNVHLIVKEAIKLLRATVPSTVEIHQDIRSECGLILGDATQIHQVVMNLCVNGFLAMDKDDGVLAISLKSVETEQEIKLKGCDLQPTCLKLTVQDNGCGMTPDIVAKIFEPYFTTRTQGQGTGLGLAVVKRIVEASGGSIFVESTPGIGTKFEVFFPLAEEDFFTELQRQDGLPMGRNEMILVVDDEAPLAFMMEQMLEVMGYRAVGINNCGEAFQMFVDDPQSFDLVITDLTMPRITGLQFTEKILAIRPDMPVILCTGYVERIDREQARAMGIREVIYKPFTDIHLGQVIRAVLDEQATMQPALIQETEAVITTPYGVQ
ncbi:MAG: response regulator [Proteobacteria bacterium]|nr:response regulator [Pseudomonadota bacterium]MBU1687194.1 response regulator [Pseudomonadota bacterium]